MNCQSENYSNRGVSYKKEDVQQAVKNLHPGLFAGAFCKILPFKNRKSDIMILHADTAGTKPLLNYLYWKETGDLSVFRDLARDAVVMNTDDILCAGLIDNFTISTTISRNKFLIPAEIIKELIAGVEECAELFRNYKIAAVTAGGETADAGDVIRTLDTGCTVFSCGKSSEIIDNSRIAPGLCIVGLESSGRAIYENAYNSGIGSNGLTSCRHDLFSSWYPEHFPEALDPYMPKEYAYTGKFRMNDPLPGTEITIGRAVISPTRTYAPVMKEILPRFRKKIKGLVHCTGGGQTKCLKFSKQIHFIKNNLFIIPPLFRLIAEKTSMKEMWRVFNMGHRLEIFTDEKTASGIIEIAASFHIKAKIIGYTEPAAQNTCTISHEGVTYEYS